MCIPERNVTKRQVFNSDECTVLPLFVIDICLLPSTGGIILCDALLGNGAINIDSTVASFNEREGRAGGHIPRDFNSQKVYEMTKY